jgi:deoxycytidylate deaminase
VATAKKRATAPRRSRPKPAATIVQPSPLSPRPFPEIVLGLVGPVGIDLDPIVSAISDELEAVEYRVKTIRLSGQIESFFAKDFASAPEHERISKLMTLGTRLREKSERGDAVALLAIAEIRRLRKQELGKAPQNNAFILRSLKHPHEVETLRSVYGKGFYLISVYTPRPERVSAMAEKVTRSQHGKTNQARAKAEAIVERDELEEKKSLGQDVKDAFPLADLFIDGRDKSAFEGEIKRFIELVFGNLFHTPSRDEHGMYHARSAALRSADLGRQVGAAISASSGELIALGCNDVPKAGGDLYWTGDEGDARDFQRGFDPIVAERKQILSELLAGLRAAKVLDPQYRADEAIAPLTRSLITGEKRAALKGARIMNLLEFGRSVHAEMAAITSAARMGVPVRGATLYTTTFPCHMCARHIVASGIKRVVYVEPYPKSKAKDLHGDAIQVDPAKPRADMVTFEPFVGVAPRQYQDLFDAKNQRKDGTGNIFNWHAKGVLPSPRFTRFQNTYRDIEDAIVAFEVPALAKQLGVNLANSTRRSNAKVTNKSVRTSQGRAAGGQRVARTQARSNKA